MCVWCYMTRIVVLSGTECLGNAGETLGKATCVLCDTWNCYNCMIQRQTDLLGGILCIGIQLKRDVFIIVQDYSWII